MRVPIIVLIVIYAIAVIGLTLVPGVDAEGQVAAPLSFFHAFYFVSYTATTIGFGEIPTAFSDAQRLWVTICIYLTVIGWLNAGTLLVQSTGVQCKPLCASSVWTVGLDGGKLTKVADGVFLAVVTQ